MKKSFLYSAAGLVVLAVVIIAVNWAMGFARARVDLTDGNVYSLSDATRTMLMKLPEPVKIRYQKTVREAKPAKGESFNWKSN